MKIKHIIKYLSFRLYLTMSKVFIRTILLDKTTLPRNTVLDVFEFIDNQNNSTRYKKKIYIPYTDVSILDQVNLNKPYELIEANLVAKNSEYRIGLNQLGRWILPLAILDNSLMDKKSYSIQIAVNDNSYDLMLNQKNRIHYIPLEVINTPAEVIVRSEHQSNAIGRIFQHEKPLIDNKPKLVVHIFIDALAQSFLDSFGRSMMTYTNEYFSKGSTIYENAYAQAEWTLSSMASVFTGKYTNQHLIYHPRNNDKIAHETLASTLRSNGYYTYCCTNIPKLSPLNGFDKGFDRYILAQDKDYNFVINEAIEQLSVVKGNQYLFIGLFDLHESHKLSPIGCQVMSGTKDFNYIEIKGNSKDTSILFDSDRLERYKHRIYHLDMNLKRLYDVLNKNDHDAITVLHSDHGINFMTQTTQLLGKEREKVIFMYKNNEASKTINTVKEIRAIPGMILDDLNIENEFYESELSYALTESLYPGKDYEIAIRNDTYVAFYKVAWLNIINAENSSEEYSIQYYNVNDESQMIDENDDLKKLKKIAIYHHRSMINNMHLKR